MIEQHQYIMQFYFSNSLNLVALQYSKKKKIHLISSTKTPKGPHSPLNLDSLQAKSLAKHKAQRTKLVSHEHKLINKIIYKILF